MQAHFKKFKWLKKNTYRPYKNSGVLVYPPKNTTTTTWYWRTSWPAPTPKSKIHIISWKWTETKCSNQLYNYKPTSDTHEMPLDFKKALKCCTDFSYSRSDRSRSFTNKHTSLCRCPSPFGSFLKPSRSPCQQDRMYDSTVYVLILYTYYILIHLSDYAVLLPQYQLYFSTTCSGIWQG